MTTQYLISVIGTFFLIAVALFAIFYPQIRFHFVKPKLSATFDVIDEGKGGLNFQVYNFGKTPAHRVIATLRMVNMEDGATFGTYTVPWKSYSLGFLKSERQMIEAEYGPIAIYPNQKIDTRGFEIINVGKHRVLGLNALPYRPSEQDSYPPVFWELDKLQGSIEAKLEVDRFYAVYLTLSCDELTVPVQRLVMLKWDGKRIMTPIDHLSLEFKKQSALAKKQSDNTRSALKAQEKKMLEMLMKFDKKK